MMVHGMIMGMCLSMLVVLGGLFLLAYAKKEGLGKMTKIASYVAVAFGTVIFVGGLVCSMWCSGSCGEKRSCKKGAHCKMEMMRHGGHGQGCHDEMMWSDKGMSCHKKVIIMDGSKCGMKCSKSDTGCCKDGVCKNADKDCCKGDVKEEIMEIKTEVKTK